MPPVWFGKIGVPYDLDISDYHSWFTHSGPCGKEARGQWQS